MTVRATLIVTMGMSLDFPFCKSLIMPRISCSLQSSINIEDSQLLDMQDSNGGNEVIGISLYVCSGRKLVCTGQKPASLGGSVASQKEKP